MKEFDSGAVRSDATAKVRYDLVPFIGIRKVAEACAEGAEKYGPHNYKKGIPTSNLVNHALNHIALYMSGDTSEDHLGHAAWNILVAAQQDEIAPHNNDIPERGLSFCQNKN